MAEPPVYVDNELFLGRLDEQDQFRDVLLRVLDARQDDAPYIFLLHGEGGMGKSQLTRRLCDLAESEEPFAGRLHVLRVDWELVRNATPSLRVAREQIRPEDVLDALHRAALDCGWGRHFGDYQKTVKQRAEAEREVAKALDQASGDSRYSALRDLGAAGLARLIRQALPAVGQGGEDLARALLAAGIQAGAEQAAVLRQQAENLLRARLKPDLYDIYRQPHEQLARALGRGLQRVARDRPLVLLLDTYEIVAVADAWLRQAIRAAGPRVVWLISGRDDLAASRPGLGYVGYSAEFSRRLVRWDIQELAIEYVRDYIRDRAPDRKATRDDAAAIHRATLGVPLALRQAADLWAQGIAPSAICDGIPDHAPRDTIVRLMCERVLMHVEAGEAGDADRRALYLLAMQPRPDAEVQAVVLRPGAGPFDLGARLADLARRYSAVRLEDGARLHDAMGAFVREHLLGPEALTSTAVKDVAARAAEALRARRDRLEAGLTTLAERVASDDWKQASIDLVCWLFWLDEPAAWRELVPRLVEGLGYNEDLAWSLLNRARAFERAMSADGKKRLKRLAAGKSPTPSDLREGARKRREPASSGPGEMLDELERLAERGGLAGGSDEMAAERRAVLFLSRGRWLDSAGHHAHAVDALLAADRLLPDDAAELSEQLGQAFYEVSNGLLWPPGRRSAVRSKPGLQAAQKAVERGRESGGAWYNLGVALDDLGRPQEAIDAHCRAIELDAKNAYPLNGLGNVYYDLGRPQEAIDAFRRAIELDARYAFPWNGLGNVYYSLGRHKEAIDAFRHAIELDTRDAYPWNGVGTVYADLGRPQEAIDAYRRAVELDARDPYPWNGLGTVNYSLGRHEEAIDAFRRAIELDARYATPHSMLGALHELEGRLEEALVEHRRAVELEPNDGVARSSLASVLRKLGCIEEAAEQLARARELVPHKDYYNRACLEAIAGNPDAAIDHLAQALARTPGRGGWARGDPDLESLHGDPRFEALVGAREGGG